MADSSKRKAAPARNSQDRLWVVTTNPDQVKDKDVMRDIRAHALKSTDYHKSRAKVNQRPISTATSPTGPPKKRKLNNAITDYDAPPPTEDPRAFPENSYPLPAYTSPFNTLPPNTPYSPNNLNRNFLRDHLGAGIVPPRPPSRNLAINDLLNPVEAEFSQQIIQHASPKFKNTGPIVIDEADDDIINLLPVVKSNCLRNPSSRRDPFNSMPQFSNPRVSVERLQYFCAMLHNNSWGPQHEKLLMGSRLVFLSSVAAGAAYQETLYDIPGESMTSLAIKTELIGMINERLRNPSLQASDETIAAVCHMINFEVYHSEPGLVTHIRGLEQLVLQRGGLAGLANGGTASNEGTAQLLANGLRFHSKVMGGLFVNELQPHPRWQNYKPPPPKISPPQAQTPLESPVHGIRTPRATSTLIRACAPETFQLLCDMHDLTTMFLDHDQELSKLLHIDSVTDINSAAFRFKNHPVVRTIYTNLLSLPSASVPGHCLSKDWIYESIRLCSLFYATAIVEKVAFSSAVTIVSAVTQTPFLLRQLSAALRASNTTDTWGDMAGPLWWVSTVACPASHLPAGYVRSKEDDVAKKWFIMTAIRTFTITAATGGHGAENMAAMNRCSRVLAGVMRSNEDVNV